MKTFEQWWAEVGGLTGFPVPDETTAWGKLWASLNAAIKPFVKRAWEAGLATGLEQDDDFDPIGPVHGSADDPCPQPGFHFHRMYPDGRVFTQLRTGEPWHVGVTVDGPVADPQPEP